MARKTPKKDRETIPVSTAVASHGAADVLSDGEMELLKKVYDAGEAGYTPQKPIERRLMQALLDRNLVQTVGQVDDRGQDAHSTAVGEEKEITLLFPVDQSLPAETFNEGSVQEITVDRYERDPKARRACIAHYGAICCICGFDFNKTYGPTMAGFIHVHHMNPLSAIGEDHQVVPVSDLRPVCPNCHAVIHSRETPLGIEEVKVLLKTNRTQQP